MERSRKWLAVLVIISAMAEIAPRARADDPFLDALSKVATREIRKQLRDRRTHFVQGSLEGNVQAVDPDAHFEADVKDFELGNDLLTSTVSAAGRFKFDGKLNQEADVSALFDVKFKVAAQIRFVKEGDKFFVEPTIKDLEMTTRHYRDISDQSQRRK